MVTQNRTRSYYLLLFLVCSALLTAQCGPASDTPRPADVAAGTIRWQTWEMTSQAEETLIEQFQETYPQVEFERKGMNDSLADVLDETPPPDLFNTDAGQDLDAMIRQNRVADVTEIWSQSGLLEQVPASLQGLTARDGKQFYVPFGFGWVGIYYNKQIFADYGLTPPETWDEFLQICATLRANGETPLAVSANEPWSTYLWFEYLNLRLNGPDFHKGLLTGREHYDDLRVRTVLETWQSLFTNDYYVENPQLLGGMDMIAALVRNERASDLTREKAVMTLTETYNSSQLPQLFLDELGFFRFPIVDPDIPVAEVVYPFGYGVPVGADHIPQAMAFLTHMSTPAAQIIIAQEGIFSGVTYAPMRRDVDKSLLRADQQQALVMLEETAVAVPHMWLALPGTVWGGMSYEFTRFVRKPHDIEIFMEQAEAARQRGVASGQLTQE
ncbi:MAG: carbohydrate ABC transporter substrate-binding protein [Caldilineaceae bacterium]|nr:carbohydrate ABC transporter substrate-binding protein [Caldilineaceae bacterium]